MKWNRKWKIHTQFQTGKPCASAHVGIAKGKL